MIKRPRQWRIILAVFLLAYQIAASGDLASANRDAVLRCLRELAQRAQEYERKPWKLGGGQGSFANLTLSDLTSRRSIPHGSFALSSPTASSVTLTGTGVETGNDGATPVEVEVIVYADSMTVTVTN